MDGGIVFAGMSAWRPEDVLSFGATYARISDGARRRDADAVGFNGNGFVRSAERMLSVNYQALVLPGWQVDLDFQRVFNPSGGVVNPSALGGALIPSASIVTLHSSIKY